MGKNKFCVNDNDGKVIFPPTETTASWYGSIYYRKQIVKALTKKCKLIEPEAEEITNILCTDANKKINWLERRGAFSQSLEDEKQDDRKNIHRLRRLKQLLEDYDICFMVCPYYIQSSNKNYISFPFEK